MVRRPFWCELEYLVLILDRRPLSLLVIGAAYGLFQRKTSTIVIVTRDPREELSPALDMFGQDVDGMITHEYLDIGSTPCLDFKEFSSVRYICFHLSQPFSFSPKFKACS